MAVGAKALQAVAERLCGRLGEGSGWRGAGRHHKKGVQGGGGVHRSNTALFQSHGVGMDAVARAEGRQQTVRRHAPCPIQTAANNVPITAQGNRRVRTGGAQSRESHCTRPLLKDPGRGRQDPNSPLPLPATSGAGLVCAVRAATQNIQQTVSTLWRPAPRREEARATPQQNGGPPPLPRAPLSVPGRATASGITHLRGCRGGGADWRGMPEGFVWIGAIISQMASVLAFAGIRDAQMR